MVSGLLTTPYLSTIVRQRLAVKPVMAGLLPQHVQDVALSLHVEEKTKPSLKLSVQATRWLRSEILDIIN